MPGLGRSALSPAFRWLPQSVGTPTPSLANSSAVQTTLNTFVVPPSALGYCVLRAQFWAVVTVWTAGSATWSVLYTDENGLQRTLSGAGWFAGGGNTAMGGVGQFYTIPIPLAAKSGTTVTMSITGVATVTADYFGVLDRLQ
jgi:hypothetical protein